MRIFVEKMIGKQYIENAAFDIQKTLEITQPNIPLFFVLFPGVDPTKEVELIGQQFHKTSNDMTLIDISMGQG